MNTIIVTGVQIYPTKLLAKLGGFFLFSLTTVRLSVAYGCNPTHIYLSKNWAIFKMSFIIAGFHPMTVSAVTGNFQNKVAGT